MEIRLLPEAEVDLDDAWLYVSKISSSIEIANRLVDKISDRLALIRMQPQIGRSRDHDLSLGFRSFPVSDYVVFYRVEGDVVIIHRVLRGSRDIESILGDSI